jgi:hypothetical protein
LKLLQHCIQPLVLFLKVSSILFQPTIDIMEPLRAKGVDAALGFRPHLDKPSVAQRSKVLGCLRLPHPKSFGDSPHRQRLTKQKVDDLETAWFSERSKSFEHLGVLFYNENIRVKEYNTKGKGSRPFSIERNLRKIQLREP